ncbi:substrate-binding periplasmic protein [Kiloniella antarctica]|uniref:Substrate-binding periplasmic protein n=1 Tax=Kiloniella antarctica TaxID=1550907 RepID=A0ABW5BKD0_9PROT
MKYFTFFIMSFALLNIWSIFHKEARAEIDPLSEEGVFVACAENQSYPPYIMGSNDIFSKQNPGVLVEIITAAVEESGLLLKFIRRPWKRCMKLLEQNKIDGIFASIYRQEREVLGRYPLMLNTPNNTPRPDPKRRLHRVVYSLFKNKTSVFNWNGDTFSSINHSIGTPLGYVVVKKLQEDHGIKANTVHLPSKGLRYVAEGHLDAYVLESNIGRNLIRELNLSDSLIEIKPSFAEYDWYLMISHKLYNAKPRLAEKIWNAIGDYRESHMQQLLEHYRTLP